MIELNTYLSRPGRLTSIIAVTLLAAVAAAQADDGNAAAPDGRDLEPQRALFRAHHAEIERGNWTPGAAADAVLRDYVLWPDLRATWFRARLGRAADDEISAFMHQYGQLKPARELRYRYALHLAKSDRLDEYLTIYSQFYQGLDVANLDCLALRAEINAGNESRVVSRAIALWLTGSSQVDECDPLFAHLQAAGILDEAKFAERYELAVGAQQFGLARYLARQLPARYLDEATAWLQAQNSPRDFVTANMKSEDNDMLRRQLLYAVTRHAYREPLESAALWHKVRKRFEFSPQQENDISRHIALWSARNHLPESVKMLSGLRAGAVDTEAGRWLIRANLREHRWADAIRAIDALPAEENAKPDWQYWKAMALRQDDKHSAEAKAIFARVAGERSYYGFLAADAIDAPYAMSDAPLRGDPASVEKLAQNPALIRARELFFVGEESRGRSEWDAAVRNLDTADQTQAALLAHIWGWHSRAIATVATAGQYDDLRLRYPLPWRDDFANAAASAGISNSWAYGIARSESLFMSDIQSSAGAIGVMQLMPATGRMTAKELQLPYKGQATLTDSTSNIRLGTWYLGKMYTRFGSNRILATAAYNAGPSRVERWLPASGELDARIWIENIPYNETRGYVRRVLTDDTIFSWRLTGELRRLSSELPQIVAAARREKAANTD